MFGLVNHNLLPDILEARGLSAQFSQLIADTYTGGELLYNSPDGEARIPERTGVKQGCSLRAVFVNLYLAGVLDSAPLEAGYCVAIKKRIPAAAFADNICLL